MTIETDSSRRIALDAVALAVVALMSLAPYRTSLGFYSDDYAVLASFANAADQSISGLISAMMSSMANIRPVQVLIFALLYDQFGLSPLGYQVVSWLVYLTLSPVLYLVMLGLRQPRIVAFTVAVVFACLPQCSTNRFWFSALQIPLSTAFYFGGLFCDVRGTSSDVRHWFVWQMLGVIALLSSTLAYELTLPFFLLNPFIIELSQRSTAATRSPALTGRLVSLFVRNMVAITAVAAFKLIGNRRDHTYEDPLAAVIRHLQEALVFHRGESAFGFNLWQFIDKDLVQFGVGLPYTALKALFLYPHVQDILWATAAGAAAAAFIYPVAKSAPPLSPIRWLTITATGLALALAGYAIFILRENVMFTLAGLGNRTSMMSVPGISIALVAAIGLISTALPEQKRPTFFAAWLAILIASGTLVNAVIESFFVEATRRQHQTLNRISELLPSGVSGGTLLIDGLCPYYGPAVVFEAPWDMTGALRITLSDSKLLADVVSSSFFIKADGIHTAIYGDESIYFYGQTLMAARLGDGSIAELRDRQTAEMFFGQHSRTACAPAHEGVGVRIF